MSQLSNQLWEKTKKKTRKQSVKAHIHRVPFCLKEWTSSNLHAWGRFEGIESVIETVNTKKANQISSLFLKFQSAIKQWISETVHARSRSSYFELVLESVQRHKILLFIMFQSAKTQKRKKKHSHVAHIQRYQSSNWISKKIKPLADVSNSSQPNTKQKHDNHSRVELIQRYRRICWKVIQEHEFPTS